MQLECYLCLLSITRRSTTWSLVWMARWSEPTEPTKMWVSEWWMSADHIRLNFLWLMLKTFLFDFCHYLLAFPRTSGQAVCQRDRAAGWGAGWSIHNPEWCKFQNCRALYTSLSASVTVIFTGTLCKHQSSNVSWGRSTKFCFTVYWLCDSAVEYSWASSNWFIYVLIHLTFK